MTDKRKYAVERHSTKRPAELERALNAKFAEGYKLMTILPFDADSVTYFWEFIGQGFETLPNRTEYPRPPVVPLQQRGEN